MVGSLGYPSVESCALDTFFPLHSPRTKVSASTLSKHIMNEAKESEVVPPHDPEAIPPHDGPETGWLPTPIPGPSLSRATVAPDSEAPEVVEPNDLDIQPPARLQGSIVDVPELDEKPNEGRNLLDGALGFRNTLKKSYKGDPRRFRWWVIGCIAVIVAISLTIGLVVGLQHQSSRSDSVSTMLTVSQLIATVLRSLRRSQPPPCHTTTLPKSHSPVRTVRTPPLPPPPRIL
jgi:hypothetical protein